MFYTVDASSRVSSRPSARNSSAAAAAFQAEPPRRGAQVCQGRPEEQARVQAGQ
jgi:hypothetical protein